MRVKRAKANKKAMALYALEFGFRSPFQILLDGNFLHVTARMKLNVPALLAKILQAPVHLFTTTCVLSELRALGPDFAPAVTSAKDIERRRCGHEKPVGASNCLKSVIAEDNRFRFVVATQELALRIELRKIPGVPLVYVNNSVMLLEPPSKSTLAKMKEIEVQKTLPRKFEEEIVKKITPDTRVAAEPTRTFKKKAKGPNPLSVKKKAKKASTHVKVSPDANPNPPANIPSNPSNEIKISAKRKREDD